MTSKTQRVLDYIKAQGAARTDDIRAHLNDPKCSISAMLDAYVKDGTLISCLVERPGQKPCNEYRLSTGGPTTRAATPVKPRQSLVVDRTPSQRPPRPATVRHQIVDAPLAPVPPSAPAPAPAAERAPVVPRSTPAPAAPLAPPPRLDMTITAQGEIALAGAGGPPLRLARHDIAALERFIAATKSLWSVPA